MVVGAPYWDVSMSCIAVSTLMLKMIARIAKSRLDSQRDMVFLYPKRLVLQKV
jgi:hypothetical protein